MTTLEDVERTARRVLGAAHPDVIGIERSLRNARAALRARETPPPPPPLPVAPQPPLPVAPPLSLFVGDDDDREMDAHHALFNSLSLVSN